MRSGSNSWELLKQQPSPGAAAAAVADMIGISSSGPAAAAAGAGSNADALLRVQVSRQALCLLLALITAVRERCCITGSSSKGVNRASLISCYSLCALQPAGLLQLLTNNIIGVGDGVDYCCKVLAAAAVAEISQSLQDIAQLQKVTAPHVTNVSNTDGRNDNNVSHIRHDSKQRQQGGAGAGPAVSVTIPNPVAQTLTASSHVLVDCLEPLITRVLMPVAGKQLPGFRSKCLVKSVLEVLVVMVEGPLIGADDWSQVWAAIGGTFWISRWVGGGSDIDSTYHK